MLQHNDRDCDECTQWAVALALIRANQPSADSPNLSTLYRKETRLQNISLHRHYLLIILCHMRLTGGARGYGAR